MFVFSLSCSHTILISFLLTKRHGSIPMGIPPPNWALNAGKVGRNSDSEPISDFSACCQHCDRLDVINTAPPDRGQS